MPDYDDSRDLNIARLLAAEARGLICIRNAGSKVKLVFVHGFRTNSLETWGLDRSYFWPHQIGKDAGADVYCYQYDNGLTRGADRGTLDYKEIAIDLARELIGLSADKIIFVTHSFGGLIIKSMMVQCMSLDPAFRRLALKVFGLCAISCPNYGHWLAWVTPLLSGGFRSSNAKLLYHRREVHELHVEFMDTKNTLPNLRILTISEEGKVWLFFRIPPSDSKIRGATNFRSQLNHRNISRNLMPDSNEFRWTLAFVDERRRARDLLTLP